MQIPEHLRNAPWDSFMKSQGETNPALDVSLEVESKVQQLKSAIKSSRKPRKAVLANTAVRASARKSNNVTDASLETQANSRNRRNVQETPLNSAKTPFTGMTPMITPKFDTSQMTRTVSRAARENEVAVSLNGSPITPCLGHKSKAGKAVKTNHAQIPLAGGQTLNLPMDGFQLDKDSVDDEQLKQLEKLSKNLQNSLKNIKAIRVG